MSIDDTLQELANTVYQHGKATRTNIPFHYGEPIAQAKQALYKDMVELIEDNIIYGNEQISKDELLEAVRKYYGVEE